MPVGQESPLGLATPTGRPLKSRPKTTTIELTRGLDVAGRRDVQDGTIGLLASHATPSVGRKVHAVTSIAARTRSREQTISFFLVI